MREMAERRKEKRGETTLSNSKRESEKKKKQKMRGDPSKKNRGTQNEGGRGL